jgi:hypothetical protein
MRSILSKATTGAIVAGAALLVAACGSAGNNTATANVVDNGTEMGNDMMAPTDMNAPMPDANAPATDMNAPMTTDMNATSDTNASNGM